MLCSSARNLVCCGRWRHDAAQAFQALLWIKNSADADHDQHDAWDDARADTHTHAQPNNFTCSTKHGYQIQLVTRIATFLCSIRRSCSKLSYAQYRRSRRK